MHTIMVVVNLKSITAVIMIITQNPLAGIFSCGHKVRCLDAHESLALLVRFKITCRRVEPWKRE